MEKNLLSTPAMKGALFYGAKFLVGLSLIFMATARAETLPKAKEYIELNHPLHENMVTYPGLSEVKLYTRLERGENGAIIDGITLLGISGTYIDAPFHADPRGKQIADYPLEKLVNLPVIVIPKAPGKRTFDVADFAGKDVSGKAVLLLTGQDAYFGKEEYSRNPPYLSTAGAVWLVEHHAALVGIDSVLIDNYHDSSTIPVHETLLNNGIVIAEDMTNIASVMGKNAWLTAVPPRVPMASFPTRIFATVY